MSVWRDEVSERLAVGAGVWLVALAIGCGSGLGSRGGADARGGSGPDASQTGTGGTAGGAPDGSVAACPHTAPGERVSEINDGCRLCPGTDCASADRCESEFHMGGPTDSICACVDGHMGCCTAYVGYTKPDLVSPAFLPAQCNYGSFTAPTCPATPPADGEPCGSAPNGCRYDDPCCAGAWSGRNAFCLEGRWSVTCFSPADGATCSDALAGTRCDQTAAHDGAAFACLCQPGDAGTPTWHCGPDA
jgi:hypothetical protein